MSNKFDDYLNSESVQNLAANTRLMYQNSLRHAQNFISGHRNKIATSTLNEYEWLSFAMPDFARYLEKQKMSGKSIQQILTGVKIFLKWAGYKTEFVYRISNEDRQAHKLKHLLRWFDENDVARCLDYMFMHYEEERRMRSRILVRLLVETGGRIGEIAAIRKEHIDLEERTVIIQGKTNPRPVFFSPRTATMIRQYKKYLKDSKDLDWEGELFPSKQVCTIAIQDMLVALGMKKSEDGRGAHTFRHYFASKLFFEGQMRIEDVAFLMGDGVDVVRDTYLHPTAMNLREKVDIAMKWEEG